MKHIKRKRPNVFEQRDPNYTMIEESLSSFFNSNFQELDLSKLNSKEKRITKGLSAIIYSINKTIIEHNESKNKFPSRDVLYEGMFMIRALYLGEDHEVRKFFASKRKPGRPFSDPYAKRRIVLAEACKIILESEGMSAPQAREEIEKALNRKSPPITASQLESYFNKNDDVEARKDAYELIVPILNSMRGNGKSVSPIDVLLMLWGEYGPSHDDSENS